MNYKPFSVCHHSWLMATDSLNDELPIKIARKSFKENDSMSAVKVVGSEAIHIGQVPIKYMD